MSAAEIFVTQPPAEPAEVVGEVARARREAPEFPAMRARVIARARGEVYSPERHGPFTETPYTPKRIRTQQSIERQQAVGNLGEIIDRYMAKVPQQRERKDLA